MNAPDLTHNKQTVFESPTYRLEILVTETNGLVSLDFLVTYPQALRPHTVRKAQFNLPREAVARLGEYLLKSFDTNEANQATLGNGQAFTILR